jgi:hypothetical protein
VFDESGDRFKMTAVISYVVILGGAFAVAMGLYLGLRTLKII